MPVASTRTEPVPQMLDAMSDSTTSSTTANDLDLIFLKGIMESPLEQEESLKEPRPSPVRENNVELLQEILRDLNPFTDDSETAAELTCILTQPHFQSLLETHDTVASQACDSPAPSPCDFVDHEQEDCPTHNLPPAPDAIRMVGIRKVAGEHLGVTFKVEGGELIIARILHGGMIDQQGLLHVGDVIKEVNGREVGQDARVLQEELQATSGNVVLKILPSYHETIQPRQTLATYGLRTAGFNRGYSSVMMTSSMDPDHSSLWGSGGSCQIRTATTILRFGEGYGGIEQVEENPEDRHKRKNLVMEPKNKEEKEKTLQ